MKIAGNAKQNVALEPIRHRNVCACEESEDFNSIIVGLLCKTSIFKFLREHVILT